jgi:anti-sigma regulatory factor (Ser/Thr protein kinase)
MRRTRTFSRHPESVRAARRFATETLTGLASDVLDAVELMVSELATNSIRHAGTAFEMTVARQRGEIRVEVTDRAGGEPRMRSAGPEDPTGRGLQIVNLLSETWGVEHRPDTGKTVWFTVGGPMPLSDDRCKSGEPAPL